MSSINYNQYFKDLTIAANSGDKNAISKLQNGYLITFDYRQTFDSELITFYKDHKNKPYSKFYYGRMNLLGQGIPRNIPKAIKLLLSAKKLGCTDAIIELAALAKLELYEDDTYANLIQEAANLGSFIAYYIMAFDALEEGKVNDYLKYLKKSLKLGNIDAWDKLGQYYQDKEDFAKAKKYYEKGVDAGSVNACFELGVMYREGYGIKVNKVKCVELFEKAAELGSVEAIVSLGVLYAEEGDDKKAKKYAKMGVKMDDPFACFNLGKIYLQEDKKLKAVIAFLKGARLEDFSCIMKLNKMGIESSLDPNDKQNLKKIIEQRNNFHEAFKNFGAYDGEW